MKLKCDLHGRRVITGQFGFIHRTGDGVCCSSYTATIGGTILQVWRPEGGEASYISTEDRLWAKENIVSTTTPPKHSKKKNRKGKRNAA